MTALVPRALRAGQARRRYARITWQITTVMRDLEVPRSRLERYLLIDQWARMTSQLAGLHPIAYGPDPLTSERTDLAEVLAQSATLLNLAAVAERTVAESDWQLACELQTGDRFWFEGWATASLVTPVSAGIRVEYAGGTRREVFRATELVRTDGPDRFTAVELACDAGASFDEAHEWYLLSTTADHDHRAAMFGEVSEYAARRVGAAAAGVLADLGATEDGLAKSGGVR